MSRHLIYAFCFFSLISSTNNLFAQQPRLVLPIGHTDMIYSAQFSPDGKKIIPVSKDNTTKLWDAGKGYLLATFRQKTGYLTEARFSPGLHLFISFTLQYAIAATKRPACIAFAEASAEQGRQARNNRHHSRRR